MAAAATGTKDSNKKDNEKCSDESSESVVCMYELVSTAIDACHRGCQVIRKVHAKRCSSNESNESNSNDDDDDDDDDEDKKEEDKKESNLKNEDINISYKVSGDPRSALTEADVSAQSVIVSCLRSKKDWGCDLCIVGEEEDLSSSRRRESDETVFDKYGILSPKKQPLSHDLVLPPATVPSNSDSIDSNDNKNKRRKIESASTKLKLKNICVYIDPMDGTREFVEGRLHNVQSLIGVTYNGTPLAGIAGLPFAASESKNNGAQSTAVEVVYATTSPPGSNDTTSSKNDASLGRFAYEEQWNKWIHKPFLPHDATHKNGNNNDKNENKGNDKAKNNDNTTTTTTTTTSEKSTLAILSGDSAKPDLLAATAHIRDIVKAGSSTMDSSTDSPSTSTNKKSFVIQEVIAGGCGNKVLQAALSAAASTSFKNTLAIVPKGTCAWDTAAPTAILLASLYKYKTPGKVTDFFGDDLVYDGTETNVENGKGALISVGYDALVFHEELCRRLKVDGMNIYKK